MTVSGLNHVTLATSDVDRAVIFYRDVLGCRLRAKWSAGAYMEMGDVWLCLSLDPAARVEPHPDYTHLALSTAPETFDELKDRLIATTPIWKRNQSEGASVYFLDPDGHKLELHLGGLESRLAAMRETPPRGFEVFD